ncbi:MAG: RNA pseudouridine synthase [Opitutales bacterium]|nr:RNA pseudouridine synthase [Opitutales bacterium]
MDTEAFIKKIPFAKKASAIAFAECGAVAIDKGAGLMSHPNPGGSNSSPAILRAKYNFKGEYFSWQDAESGEKMRLYLINRLDSPTSGVMLAATSGELAQSLKKAFKEKSAKKTYYAVCVGRPAFKEGEWNDYLEVKKYGGFVRGKTSAGGIRAITRYALEASDAKGLMLSLLRLEPKTGRTHQLRVQCASHNVPILGDETYGNFAANRRLKQAASAKRMYLHCAKTEVEFEFGGKKTLFRAESPLPQSFKDIIE